MRNPLPAASAAVLLGLSGCVATSPLHSAAEKGQTARVLALLESKKGVDINAASGRWGDTALGLAAENGHIETVKALLAKGADPNAGYGDPLHSAAYAGQIEAVRLLLDAGADPGRRDDGPGGTPLTEAVSKGHLDIAKLFVERGADVRVRNNNGSSLLHAAVAGAYMSGILSSFGDTYETVEFLLAKGVDVSARNKDGRTARELAEHYLNDDAKGVAVERLRRLAELLRRAEPALAEPAAPAGTAASGISADEVKRLMAEALKEASAPKPEATAAVEKPAYRAPEDPDAYAVVVGIEKYPDLPEARFAERDARAVAEHIAALGVPRRNLVLLTGAQASRAGLQKNLETWLSRNAGERSTVYFYFSGHGAPDPATGAAYLVPVDGDPQYLEDTAYPLSRLYSKLDALKARRVIVALDACFSGAGGRSVLAKGVRPLVAKTSVAPAAGSRVAVLSAAAGDQVSGTLEEQSHGAFTYYLLRGLDGEAQEPSGRVTLSSLHRYLLPKVQDAARRSNREQAPQLSLPPGLDARLR